MDQTHQTNRNVLTLLKAQYTRQPLWSMKETRKKMMNIRLTRKITSTNSARV